MRTLVINRRQEHSSPTSLPPLDEACPPHPFSHRRGSLALPCRLRPKLAKMRVGNVDEQQEKGTTHRQLHPSLATKRAPAPIYILEESGGGPSPVNYFAREWKASRGGRVTHPRRGLHRGSPRMPPAARPGHKMGEVSTLSEREARGHNAPNHPTPSPRKKVSPSPPFPHKGRGGIPSPSGSSLHHHARAPRGDSRVKGRTDGGQDPFSTHPTVEEGEGHPPSSRHSPREPPVPLQ